MPRPLQIAYRPPLDPSKSRPGRPCKAQHGHCRIDHEDLTTPPYHSKTQFSRRFFADTITSTP
eukprot:137828-Pyramimonas_sp.AAC.1